MSGNSNNRACEQVDPNDSQKCQSLIVYNISQLWKCYFKCIIPFLVERKWKYPTFEQKTENINNLDASYRSKYDLYKTYIPDIRVYSANETTPNDFFYNNVLNIFNEKIIAEIDEWNGNTDKILQSDRLYTVNAELKKHQRATIARLNKKLRKLHNYKHRGILRDQNEDYDYNRNDFYINIVLTTLLIFTIIFTVHIIGSKSLQYYNIALIINVFLFIGFLMYFYINMMIMNERKYTNWNTINFRKVQVDQKV